MPDEQEPTPADQTHRVSTTGDVEVSTYLGIASEEIRRASGIAGQVTGGPDVPPKRDSIAIIDFGSQYSRLIARRVRELNVYCEILPPDATRDAIREMNLAGIVLSGGPSSVYEEGSPTAPGWVFDGMGC